MLSFRDVYRFLALAFQMLGEVIDQPPVEIFVHVAEAVTLVRKHEHVEAFSCLDQRIDHSHCIAWMHIVIDVAVYEQEMSLEVLRDFRVGRYPVIECRVSLLADFLLDAMVGLAPPAVIDPVVMVSCA